MGVAIFCWYLLSRTLGHHQMVSQGLTKDWREGEIEKIITHWSWRGYAGCIPSRVHMGEVGSVQVSYTQWAAEPGADAFIRVWDGGVCGPGLRQDWSVQKRKSWEWGVDDLITVGSRSKGHKTGRIWEAGETLYHKESWGIVSGTYIFTCDSEVYYLGHELAVGAGVISRLFSHRKWMPKQQCYGIV